MEEDSKFKTRLYVGNGESKIEKDTSQKSLSHEEAIKEFESKEKELLKLFSSSENENSEGEVVKR